MKGVDGLGVLVDLLKFGGFIGSRKRPAGSHPGPNALAPVPHVLCLAPPSHISVSSISPQVAMASPAMTTPPRIPLI